MTIHINHIKIFFYFIPVCVNLCIFKFTDCENNFSQKSHLNSFTQLCLLKSPYCEKYCSSLNCFTPVSLYLCLFKLPYFENDLLHKSHLNCFYSIMLNKFTRL